ncbi:MAG: glycosyltransferase, partial [Phycisphaerae bacterium]
IRFYGNQKDVRKYLVASDIYLMISRFEGISITTIEAMACNIPTILYDVPGLRDFNLKGQNSILIPENYEILVEKVIDLYLNPSIGIEIAKNAMIMVNEEYDLEKNASKVYELYL